MIPTREQIEEIACLEQRSLDWFRARLGCVTGSCVYLVVKPSEELRAFLKAQEAGPIQKESKSDFNKRIKELKKVSVEDYEIELKKGPIVESQEEYEKRLEQLLLRAKQNPFSDTTISYLDKLASQRNLRDVFVKDDGLFEQYILRTSFSSSAIRWGEETEEMARIQYSRKTGNEVAEIGFYRHSAVDWYGDSPDGLVVDNKTGAPVGSIEIKCPKSETWIRYRCEFRKAQRLHNEYVKAYMEAHPEIDSDAFVDDMLPEEQRLDTINLNTLKRIKPDYYWQCQSHCACNNVDWCDFIFYDQMQKGEMVIIRIHRNQEDIDFMLSRIEMANDYIENVILN